MGGWVGGCLDLPHFSKGAPSNYHQGVEVISGEPTALFSFVLCLHAFELLPILGFLGFVEVESGLFRKVGGWVGGWVG